MIVTTTITTLAEFAQSNMVRLATQALPIGMRTVPVSQLIWEVTA